MNHPRKSATSRHGSGRGVFLAGLIALTSGCQPLPDESPSAEVSPTRERQSLVTPPRTCQDIKNTRSLAKDGEYILYVESDRNKPWKAYCHDMAGTPVEFLTLPESGLVSNVSEYVAGVYSPGTTVRTRFHKLRIDPFSLRARAWDKTFTSSSGELRHASSTGPRITVMPYATAMSCNGGATARATVDLRGTPFVLPYSSFTLGGWAFAGQEARAAGDQVATLTGGGACGWNGPILTAWEDPLDGGLLPLTYGAPAAERKVTAHVYPVNATPTNGQALDLGWHDMNRLTVGNDAINKVHVPRGWKVTLYADSGFTGARHIYKEDEDLTGKIIDLKTSSIHVEAPVLAYTGPGYQGTELSLRPGRYTLEQLGLSGQTPRSFKVPEGFRVTLHKDSLTSGAYQVITQDTDLSNGSTLDGQVRALFIESPTQRNTNVLYGQWQSSGGRDARHVGNRRLRMELPSASDELVTFELESTNAGPVLYLVDGMDTPIAESTPAGERAARLTVALREGGGNYYLVAATNQPGQRGDFTLRADWGRLRYRDNLEVKRVTGFQFIMDDSGTGATKDLSVWRPHADEAQGYYSLGDVGMPSHGVAPLSAYVVKDVYRRGLLQYPQSYTLLWTSEGTSGRKGSLWQPVPVDGYTCLGVVASSTLDRPALDQIRCVRSEYAVQVASLPVWSDDGIRGSRMKVTMLEQSPQEARALYTSNLNGASGHFLPTLLPPIWALNRSAVDSPEFAGGFVDDYAVLQFAPRVWLHSQENFLPSTTEYFLENVVEYEGHLTTRQPLGCEDCTNPPFLKGLNPTVQHVPVYAQIIPRTVQGAPTNITDVIYWTFYNYNLGKWVCVGAYAEVGGYRVCVAPSYILGFYHLGNHVGDWEHLTVRFVDGRPIAVTMSQHGKAPVFAYGGKTLPMVDQRPEAYSALGSHGLYPDAAVHKYMDLHNGDALKDITDRGTAWKTWERPVISPWRPQGTYEGSLHWLNITADWGNAKEGCDSIVSRLSGECILNGGPGGPMQKDFTAPDYGELE